MQPPMCVLMTALKPMEFVTLLDCSRPNARRQAPPRAAATQERRLLAVACPGRIGDYSTAPPTEPYVKISLIRFLGTARFHTARLPDVADNPRHPSPSALQHVFSRLSYV